ncbi:MAG: hypothetical protein GY854_12320 [Deltaproteobacteria bacterium]|nr:hypothetical protein [Deltaproteobacteria bacterium]
MGYLACLILTTVLLAAQESTALPQDEQPQASDAKEPEAEEVTNSAPNKTSIDTLEQRLADQERENERQKQEMQAIEERHSAEIEELRARLDAADEAELDELAQETEFNPILNIYGFFDLTLYKYFVDEDNPAYGILPDKLSFVLSNLNVYLASEMTETLSALVELRFTFMPHGIESDLTSYERIDTSVTEPHSTEELQLGGVVIERAQMTWQPRDFFGISAGRFLTPFGIWNVDHGSPVLLTVQPPYLIVREFMPLAQTGLQFHGRFFPSDSLFIDYALTASNGRGPTETVYDLEDDKALGVKLKVTYQHDHITAALGGYGYFGHTTDIVKELDLSDPDTLFGMKVDTTSEYKEWNGAIDLLLELYGVRLQAEYVRGLIRYDVRPLRRMPVLDIPDPFGEKQPDYIKSDVYVLLAWQLPLDKWLGDMRLTPFGMVERSIMDDTYNDFDAMTIRAGLNFKPNSFVVLKFNAVHVRSPKSEVLDVPWWMLNGQMAVSF